MLASVKVAGVLHRNAQVLIRSNSYGDRVMLDSFSQQSPFYIVDSICFPSQCPLSSSTSISIFRTMRTILDRSSNLARLNGCGSNPSVTEIVRLLIRDGKARVNAQSGLYGNALQTASVMGHGSVVELLLPNGANVNAPGKLWSNVLQAAPALGHEKTVELLLCDGAELNARDEVWGKALRAASNEGETVVKLLLRYGTEFSAQGGI